MTRKHYIITALVFAVIAGSAYTAFAMQREHAQKTSDEKSAGQNGLTGAEYAFGVTDISRKGNIVSFTIPGDAHGVKKKADAVKISALYTGKKSSHAECPMVGDNEVKDELQDYDPFSGKAHINAVFKDEEKAREATDKGCLLIKDVD